VSRKFDRICITDPCKTQVIRKRIAHRPKNHSMHALIVTCRPECTGDIKKLLGKSGIECTTTTPRNLDKIWFHQYHIAYIHPPIEEEDCTHAIKKIRETNSQIPILLPYPITQLIENAYVLPRNISKNDITLTIKALSIIKSEKLKKNLKFQDLVLDPSKRVVRRSGKLVNLRNKAFCILEILMQNPKRIISREEITEIIWDRNSILTSNTINSHISHLRKQIDKGFKQKLIHTVHYAGYKLDTSKY